MDCNCQSYNVCTCGDVNENNNEKTYLDQQGLLHFTKLLQAALEKTTNSFDRLTTEGNKIIVKYKDGTRNTIVLDDLIQNGGGLKYDKAGKMFVDFSTMPSDRFEQILKSLGLSVSVKRNGDGSSNDLDGAKKYGDWYVDGSSANASDDVSDIVVGDISYGRGQSPQYPFKTIQACATYVSQYMNLGSRVVRININGGVYEETISLGQQNRTTGYVAFYPYGSKPVTIKATLGAGNVVYVRGGDWRFHNINTEVNGINTSENGGIRNFAVTSGGTCYVYQGNHTLVDSPSANSSAMNMFYSSGGGSTLYLYGPKVNVTQNNTTIYVVVAGHQGSVIIPSGYETISGFYSITGAGSASYLLYAYTKGSIEITAVAGSGTMPTFSGTLNASKYRLESVSSIALHNNFFVDATNLTAGYTEENAYCYYRGN